MLRQTDFCREYKNGDITIKLSRDAIAEMKEDEILYISDLLFGLDCYFIGESYCLNNWEMGHTLYNAYSNKVYIFPWACLDDLKEGKTVRLYAREPEEDDREVLAREWGMEA